MIESIINFIFSINDLWRRSSDPLVTECHGYQQRIIVWSLMSILLIIFALFISPTEATSYVVYPTLRIISLAMLAGSFAFFILVLINVINLYAFFKRNGFCE